METTFKYISFVDGPLARYRFDILLEGSPSIAEHLIVFCSEYSFKLYKDYHEKLNFVTIDSIREKYSNIISKEVLPRFATEQEWLEQIDSFYGNKVGRFFPYDLHRFALPYLAEKGILNFCIIDNDVLFQPEVSIHQKTFNRIKPGTLYQHFFGPARDLSSKIKFFKDSFGDKFSNFDFSDAENFVDSDGFVRGFHFKCKEDLLLFFDMWNIGIEKLLVQKEKSIIGVGLDKIYQLEWFVSFLMQYFRNDMDYTCTGFHELFFQDHKNVIVHKTRVEDTIYAGPRGQWERYGFDYSDTSTISSFIQNNKNQLTKYWKEHVPYVHVTDTHVYTRIYN